MTDEQLAEFGAAAYRACVYLDKAVPVEGRDNIERIRFAADEIVRLRAALEAARAENDSLQGEVNVLSREISQWEREADALRAENARLRNMIDRSNLEEVDGFTADGPALKKDGRILISKDLVDQERRISDALATAAKHARENARLREALAEYADHGNWQDSNIVWRNDRNGWETAERTLAANETPTV